MIGVSLCFFIIFCHNKFMNDAGNVKDKKNNDGSLICKSCRRENLPSFYFCPNCGKELNPKPLSTSIIRQIGIYLLSIFLPPLGLWPGIKYLKGKTANEKTIGAIAISLTLIFTAFTIWYAFELAKNVQSVLNFQFKNSTF